MDIHSPPSENHANPPAETDSTMAGVPDQPPLQPGQDQAPPQTPTMRGGQVEAPTDPKAARRERGKDVDPGERSTALNVNQAESSSKPAGQKTLEEILAEFKNAKVAKDQEEETGTIAFPATLHPRCMGTRLLWRDYLKDRDQAATLWQMMQDGYKFMWVASYKNTTISNADVELFKEGLTIVAEQNAIKGLIPSDYKADPAIGGSMAFLIGTQNDDALKRLALHKVWTIRTKAKSGTFFLSHDDSWASHIIYDVHNGGANFVKDVLPRIWKFLGGAIATKDSDKPGMVEFRDLAYYQVPFNDNTHRGAKGIVWRVRFTPSADACKVTWKAPRNLGHSNRGTVEWRRPPLCAHCISYSHPQHLCEWWREPLVAGSKTTPDHYLETKWKPIASASRKSLQLKGVVGPSLDL